MVNVGSFDWVVYVDVFGTWRFRPNNRERSLKNIFLLKVVLADDGELLSHPNMALKDQIFRIIFQYACSFLLLSSESPGKPVHSFALYLMHGSR